MSIASRPHRAPPAAATRRWDQFRRRGVGVGAAALHHGLRSWWLVAEAERHQHRQVAIPSGPTAVAPDSAPLRCQPGALGGTLREHRFPPPASGGPAGWILNNPARIMPRWRCPVGRDHADGPDCRRFLSRRLCLKLTPAPRIGRDLGEARQVALVSLVAPLSFVVLAWRPTAPERDELMLAWTACGPAWAGGWSPVARDAAASRARAKEGPVGFMSG